eukprot:5751425-Prorocentrum_lima.AAC.1
MVPALLYRAGAWLCCELQLPTPRSVHRWVLLGCHTLDAEKVCLDKLMPKMGSHRYEPDSA